MRYNLNLIANFFNDMYKNVGFMGHNDSFNYLLLYPIVLMNTESLVWDGLRFIIRIPINHSVET